MNKNDLAELIHKRTGFKRFEAYSFIEILMGEIATGLRAEKKLVLSNFGTFKVVERKEKRVLNPIKKEMMTIPGTQTIRFQPSENLKEQIGD